jgi:hypothetical protein
MVICAFCPAQDYAATVFEKSQLPKTTTGLTQNCLSPCSIGVFVHLHGIGAINYIKTECWQ